MRTVPELRAELKMLYAERDSRLSRGATVSWINYVIDSHEAQLESVLSAAPGPDMEPERTGTPAVVPWWAWVLAVSAASFGGTILAWLW